MTRISNVAWVIQEIKIKLLFLSEGRSLSPFTALLPLPFPLHQDFFSKASQLSIKTVHIYIILPDII